MTDNPNIPNDPPPPPSQPPGSGAGRGAGGFDSDAARTAFQGAHKYDLGIIAAGVLAFIFSLFPYYTASSGGFSASENAWHGFFGWFGALVALVGALLLALPLLGVRFALPVATRLAVLGAFAVATICAILALLIWPGKPSGVSGVNFGHGFGYWASLIVIVVGLVLAFLRKDATD